MLCVCSCLKDDCAKGVKKSGGGGGALDAGPWCSPASETPPKIKRIVAASSARHFLFLQFEEDCGVVSKRLCRSLTDGV